MPKQQFNFRFDPELMGWVKNHAAEFGATNVTDLLEKLLEAAREGRLHVSPRSGVNAFPADEVLVGSSPELPALIAE